MDATGEVWAHFKFGLTEVDSLPPDWNIRLGFGFRPFQPNDVNPENDGVPYDIIVMHMRRFEDNNWVLKDMFMDDVQVATSYRYSLLGERDNDWVLEETEDLPFDLNTGILSCEFKRKLIGSSNKDYTFMFNQPMEVRWTFGAWFTD